MLLFWLSLTGVDVIGEYMVNVCVDNWEAQQFTGGSKVARDMRGPNAAL